MTIDRSLLARHRSTILARASSFMSRLSTIITVSIATSSRDRPSRSISATWVSRKNRRPDSSSYCLSNVPPVTRMARGWAIVFECRDQGSGIWDPGSWFVVRDPEDPGISDEAIGFFGTRIPDHGSRRGHTGRRYCNTRHHFVRVCSRCQPFRSPFTGGKALTLKVLRVPRAGRHRACDTTGGEEFHVRSFIGSDWCARVLHRAPS